ncbi:MAG: hypothetical protein FD122_1377 [Stygiobacter sp.]|nr:MAG: hypothetical protein FD122_1377 [Stygiobacter sp.]KAF0217979.1 MAG: hypothetical protein FD178_213 [Ignavibacteria bacterium]
MFKKIMQAVMPSQKMIDMFTLKVISNQSIELIAANVQEACDKYGFALLQTYKYHEIVESKGFPIKRKVFIYEICQAKTASLMLTDHPGFSIFMPCKLAIYEQDDKTVISTMNMEIMLNAVSSNQELYNNATTLFNTLKSMMNSLSGKTSS